MTTPKKIEVEVRVAGDTYAVELEDGRVDIYRDDVWVGKGRWSCMRIEECCADLSPAVFAALDDTVAAAAFDSQCE